MGTRFFSTRTLKPCLVKRLFASSVLSPDCPVCMASKTSLICRLAASLKTTHLPQSPCKQRSQNSLGKVFWFMLPAMRCAMFVLLMDSMHFSKVDILITYGKRCSKWQRLAFKLFGTVRDVLGAKESGCGWFRCKF